jgi:hypothetical protein
MLYPDKLNYSSSSSGTGHSGSGECTLAFCALAYVFIFSFSMQYLTSTIRRQLSRVPAHSQLSPAMPVFKHQLIVWFSFLEVYKLVKKFWQYTAIHT